MFGIFTKNLDTMKRATKQKKTVRDLDDVNRLQKKEMDIYLGGNGKEEKKKSRGFFGGWFSPCEGDIPQ